MNNDLEEIWAILESIRTEDNREIINILQSNLEDYNRRLEKQ